MDRRMANTMTPNPHTIGPRESIAFAHERMRRHGVRHLPVLDDGEVVGMVTERDLHLIETLPDARPDRVLVDEAMNTDVFAVSPDATIDEVAAAMLEQKVGSAVVVDSGRVVGIFTTTDALRVLSSMLGEAPS